MGVKPVEAKAANGQAVIWQEREIEGETVNCYLYASCIEENVTIHGYAKNLRYSDGTYVPDGTAVEFEWDWKPGGSTSKTDTTYNSGKTGTFIITDKVTEDRQYRMKIYLPKIDDLDVKSETFTSEWTDTTSSSCDDSICSTEEDVYHFYAVCDQISKETEEYARCLECFADQEGVWTAVGCIPQNPTDAVASIVQIGLGIAGGIVLIMILIGAFMFSTSQGDPNKTKEAKEIITSAIIGLIFVIFSVTMLQFIGVNILQIPGFGQ